MRRGVDTHEKGQTPRKGIGRAQGRQARRLKAQRQAQALRDPTPEHAQRDMLESKGARINNANRMLTLLLFAVIVICLLLSLALGVNIYRTMAKHSAELRHVRLETSLLSNNLHQLDWADSICTAQGPEGKMLVAREESGGSVFETRFYLYEGWLVEEYVLDTVEPDPQNAEKIVQTPIFDFDFDEESGLVAITTDAGTTYVTVRSSQGGGQ